MSPNKISGGSRKWLKTSAIILVVLIAICSLTVGSYFLFFKPRELTPAPDFTLNDVDGIPFTLSNKTGKVVLLDFMSVTCTACTQMMPDLLSISEEFNDSLVILSIDVDPYDSIAQLQTYKNAFNASWQFALDTDGLVTKYNVLDIPKTIIIDKEGYITFEETGFISGSNLRDKIQETIEGAAERINITLTIEFILVFAFFAGVVSFFSPCAFPLMPGYIAFNLDLLAQEAEKAKKEIEREETDERKEDTSESNGGSESSEEKKVVDEHIVAAGTKEVKRTSLRKRLWKSFVWGTSAALGITLFYMIIGLLTALLGSVITPWLKYFIPVMGLIFIVLGILTLIPSFSLDMSFVVNAVDRILQRNDYMEESESTEVSTEGENKEELQETDSTKKRKKKKKKTNRKGLPQPVKLFIYGIGYSLASIGCNGPVLLAMISYALSSGGFVKAILAFLVYSLAMAFLMIIITLLVGFSRDVLLSKLKASTNIFKIISGIILILVGGFLIGYFLWVYVFTG